MHSPLLLPTHYMSMGLLLMVLVCVTKYQIFDCVYHIPVIKLLCEVQNNDTVVWKQHICIKHLLFHIIVKL
jgi:hypothetical protein